MASRGSGRRHSGNSEDLEASGSLRRREHLVIRRTRLGVKRAVEWPRYMTVKRLSGELTSGQCAYYWEPQKRDLDAGCPLHRQALGRSYAAAFDRANLLNSHLDAWRRGMRTTNNPAHDAYVGTVNWWYAQYVQTKAFTKLSARSQSDYRKVMRRLAQLETKSTNPATCKKRLVGDLPVSSLTQAAVDKIYEMLCDGGITRQANYAIDVSRRAWHVVSRANPAVFLTVDPSDPARRISLNPFEGVIKTYSKKTTLPCTRDEAFALADSLRSLGHPHLAVAPLVCFELLQRPENIIAGHLTWTQYRPADRPSSLEIFHHKTGKRLWHDLEVTGNRADGQNRVRFLYPELEDRLRQLPRLGIPIVMLAPHRGLTTLDGNRPPRLYKLRHANSLVAKARDMAGLPKHVTLAACRHGGMTLLGDAKLTEQQIMAASGHVTPAAARVYVKRTQEQRLDAAVQRRNFIEKKRP